MTTSGVNAVRPWAPRSRRWATLSAAVGFVAIGAFAAWPWFRERAELREALDLAEENHFDLAEPLLRRFHERRPQNVEVVRALALGYLNAHRLAETEQFLNRWCDLRPGKTEPYKLRLKFWLMQEKVLQAIEDADHVLTLKPHDFETRRQLVQLLLTDGRYQRAEEEGLRCFLEHPKDVELWFILANIYHGLGQAAKATDLLDQLLLAAPDHLGGLKLRAKLYVEAGQPEPAIRLLEERVVGKKTSPDGTEGLYELSEALVRAGRDEEAKKALAEMQWRQALGLWSKYEHRDANPGLQKRVVEAMLAAGKTDEAVHFLSGILERNPKAPPGTHQLLAVCFEKQGLSERAAEQRRLAQGKGDKETRRQGDKETK